MKKSLISLTLVALASSAGAQSADDLLIGASLPLSGPNAAAGQEGLAVAQAYFDAINKNGGIQGRRIALRALDDGFSPEKAAENARQLSADSKVLALFNCWGTSSCSAMVPVINEKKIPLVAGIAGDGPLHTAPGRYAFNVRATTEDEMSAMVRQMTSVGQNRIAVVYQDDAFGKKGLASAQSALAKASLKPAAEQALAADGSNAPTVVATLKTAGANGIILVGSPTASVKLITQTRQGGVSAPIYNLMAQATQKMVADLGDHTSGVIFSTLVPNPWRSALPIVKEYQQVYSAASGKSDYSHLSLEVFINAKILVEGLRQAGRTPSRESLVTALESMDEKVYDLMSIKYRPGHHAGSTYVGLSIISRHGRFVE